MTRANPRLPLNSRGEVRSVRRRTRTFRPNYLSFAGTYQCNLSCPHCCVPIEWPDRLDIPVALRFLEDAHMEGVTTLGFTGGEPFLYPDFLEVLIRRGAQLGYRFDKIQSNGVWHDNAGQLEAILTRVAQAGYSGKLGLSVDKFHGIHTSKAAEFCRIARRVFNRDNVVSLSYASRAPDLGLEPVQALAKELNAIVDWSELLHRYLMVSSDLTIVLNWNHLAPVERAENFTGAWDGEWFQEDFCEGPGQALIVTPKGDVKPCCGFASDLDQLTIGNIYHDSVARIIRRARRHPYVGKVFREGLSAIRDEILARDPSALPGKTTNHCFFCWYVLTRGLAVGTGGGGAQRGEWIGSRPNFAGELLQLGVLQRSGQGMGELAMISYTLSPCSLGILILAGTNHGLHFVSFAQDESTALQILFDEYPGSSIVPDDSALNEWKEAILRYLDGDREELLIPVDVPATAFQLRVWNALREIPYGETASYSQIALNIGLPTGARAVARACASNPVAVVIPCHRVIREDGQLGGYRWGLERKRQMLEKEATRHIQPPKVN